MTAFGVVMTDAQTHAHAHTYAHTHNQMKICDKKQIFLN